MSYQGKSGREKGHSSGIQSCLEAGTVPPQGSDFAGRITKMQNKSQITRNLYFTSYQTEKAIKLKYFQFIKLLYQ